MKIKINKNVFDFNSAFPFDPGIHTPSQLFFFLNICLKTHITRILWENFIEKC